MIPLSIPITSWCLSFGRISSSRIFDVARLHVGLVECCASELRGQGQGGGQAVGAASVYELSLFVACLRKSSSAKVAPSCGVASCWADAFERLGSIAGCSTLVLSSEQKKQVLEAFERDELAASTNRTRDVRLWTIGNVPQLWGIPMWPSTPASWKALSVTMKLGR